MSWTKCWFLFHDYECIYIPVPVVTRLIPHPKYGTIEKVMGEGVSYYWKCKRCGHEAPRGDMAL